MTERDILASQCEDPRVREIIRKRARLMIEVCDEADAKDKKQEQTKGKRK